MTPDSHAFALDWVAAWNAHDLERVLAHYAPEIVFRSPVAAFVSGEGCLVGHDALRAYWTQALLHYPDLHFTLLGSFGGYHGFAIRYAGPSGREVVECFECNAAGAIVRSHAFYA